jgi:uncharacterized protein (TIGR03435 family)
MARRSVTDLPQAALQSAAEGCMTRFGLLLVLVAVTGLQLTSQALTFEVISVKPNASGAGPLGLRSRPDGGFTATNVTLGILLSQAFPQSSEDMVGLPEWATSSRFDVSATAPPGIGNATPEQRRAMLQVMLADRFKLAVHYETRDVPAYDLVLARSDGRLGPQLTSSDIDCAARAAAQRAAAEAARAAGQPSPAPPSPPTVSPTETPPPCTMRSMTNRFDGHMTMASLAMVLRRMTGRVVVDKTGLTGYYTLVLESASTASGLGAAPGVAAATSELPSVFTAVQEQLGLKLVSARAPLEVLVIDHIERPTPD